MNGFAGAYPEKVLVSQDIAVLIFFGGDHIANGILVNPSGVLTSVVSPLKIDDQREFIIKYGDKTKGEESLKNAVAKPGLISIGKHDLNSRRPHFGFLEVSSCIQCISV